MVWSIALDPWGMKSRGSFPVDTSEPLALLYPRLGSKMFPLLHVFSALREDRVEHSFLPLLALYHTLLRSAAQPVEELRWAPGENSLRGRGREWLCASFFISTVTCFPQQVWLSSHHGWSAIQPPFPKMTDYFPPPKILFSFLSSNSTLVSFSWEWRAWPWNIKKPSIDAEKPFWFWKISRLGIKVTFFITKTKDDAFKIN